MEKYLDFRVSELSFDELKKINSSLDFLVDCHFEPIEKFKGKFKQVDERYIVVGQRFDRPHEFSYVIRDRAYIENPIEMGLYNIPNGSAWQTIFEKHFTQAEVDEMAAKMRGDNLRNSPYNYLSAGINFLDV